MDNKKTNGLAKLALKAGAIFGTAFAALTLGNTNAALTTQTAESINDKNIEVSNTAKKKPMTVLKLNTANPELSKLVARHSSHSSHSSHYSHSSHRSGGMFA